MDQYKKVIDLHVNGEKNTIEVNTNWTLLNVLRNKLGLTGTKCGCSRGQCGSCTVLLKGKPVLSCLTLAISCHSQEITTIEGLAVGDNIDPLQEAFVENHAMQCGFCTPGMIMSAKGLLNENPDPSEEEIKFALRGNLCRCGTYPNVVQSIHDASKKMEVHKK